MANPVKSLDDLIRRVGDAASAGTIRAYHGSPYDFDAFDASRARSGAGTQMAGHGLYFAENERIAKRYKRPPGKLYEVEIAQPQNSFLDFEAPLVDQKPAARAIAAASKRLARGDAGLYADFLAESPDGHGAYMLLDSLMGPREAATAMRELGVPGVRFLDVTGEGTRNYVMFPGTEASIRILRKYGMLAPIAAGATADK